MPSLYIVDIDPSASLSLNKISSTMRQNGTDMLPERNTGDPALSRSSRNTFATTERLLLRNSPKSIFRRCSQNEVKIWRQPNLVNRNRASRPSELLHQLILLGQLFEKVVFKNSRGFLVTHTETKWYSAVFLSLSVHGL